MHRIVCFAGLIADLYVGKVWWRGERDYLKLTMRQYQILIILMQAYGQPVPLDELRLSPFDVDINIQCAVSQLRKRLDGRVKIKAVPHLGYRLLATKQRQKKREILKWTKKKTSTKKGSGRLLN